MTFGKDCREWLKRWDAGDPVWSVDMGGIGPSYEQCIQIATVELVRYLVKQNFAPEAFRDKELATTTKLIEQAMMDNAIVQMLRLSAAQHGAATSLAYKIYINGPVGVLTDPAVVNRRIMISKNFPRAVVFP